MHIAHRYSILVTPVRVQDREEPNEFWEGRKLADSAALGDVASSQWWMYTRGFDEERPTVYTSENDLRVSKDAYQLAGIPVAAN